MRKGFAAVVLGAIFVAVPVRAQVTDAPTLTLPLVLTQTLNMGSRGSNVSLLQQFLQRYGYFTYPAITGYFGSFTQQAVTAFQVANNINPIGIAGPITRAKIAEFTEPVATSSVPVPGVKHLRHSGGSSAQSVEEPADTTAPTVSLVTDDLGDSLFGATDVATIHATGTDDVGIVSGRFLMDDTVVGGEQTGAMPYSFSFAASNYTEGQHVLSIEAEDAAGNQATSSATIYVDKTAPSIEFYNPRSQVNLGDLIIFTIDIVFSDPQFDSDENLTIDFTVYEAGDPEMVLATQTGTGADTSLQLDSDSLGLGSYTVEARVTDLAGNTAVVSSDFTIIPPEEDD